MAAPVVESAAALLQVFALFKFAPGQVIKIGSLAHLVEIFGASKETVPDATEYLLQNGLLVREEGVGLHLTELGFQTMQAGSNPAAHELAASYGGRAPAEETAREQAPLNLENPDLAEVGQFVFKREDTVGYEKLSWPEKVFICVKDIDGEVNTGGFDQYYFNSSGDHALDAVAALEAIDAKRTAGLVRQTNALFGDGGPSRDRLARQKQLDALRDGTGKEMDEIETEFYEGGEDLDGLLKNYISKNADAFGGR